MLNISIITIGDEILIGQILNSNVQFISDYCTKLGANVIYHSTIGDNKEALFRELNYVYEFSDLVITTGGLGPTEDDITKQSICEYFNDKLILNNEVLINIKELFKQRNRELKDIHYKQAEIPSKSIPLENRVGTAPGFLINEKNKTVIVLPGVPNEMKYIVNNSLGKIIERKIIEFGNEVIKYKTINTAGIFESDLAEIIGSKLDYNDEISLAYLPSIKGVRLRIGAKGNNLIEAEQNILNFENKILNKISKYIIGYDNNDLINLIKENLIKRNLTISTAESCTGGLLGSILTSIDGSSKYYLGGIISYSNEVKNKLLNVNNETLIKYGAVSFQTAEEMAKNVKDLFKSDISISITGIAGPTGGTIDKPVGTVFIGLAFKDKVQSYKYNFGNDRNQNRERASYQSLLLVNNIIYENFSN